MVNALPAGKLCPVHRPGEPPSIEPILTRKGETTMSLKWRFYLLMLASLIETLLQVADDPAASDPYTPPKDDTP